MMKVISTAAIISCLVLLCSTRSFAQTKLGYVSSQELIVAMPEARKADSALQEYQQALNAEYEEMVQDFRLKDSLLQSRDTLKYTKAQLELKRRELAQLYTKIQGWPQEANRQYQNREQQLMLPIYDKARKAISDVAKENGYAYVFAKEQLLSFPPGDDLLPLVKKKLNIK